MSYDDINFDPNLPPDIQVALQQQRQRQRITDLLTQNSMQDLKGQMVGDIYVPPSPFQGLAQLGEAYAANRGSDAATKVYQALADKIQQGKTSAMQNFMNTVTGSPETAGHPLPQDAQGNVTITNPTPAVAPNPMKALADAYSNPYIKDNPMLGIYAKNELDKSPQNKLGPIDPDKFTPASIAAYSKSGNYGELVPKEDDLGKINQQDYTPESFAKYQQTKNRGDLTPYRHQDITPEEWGARAAAAQAAKNPADPLWTITHQQNPDMDTSSPEFAAKWEENRMKEKTQPGIDKADEFLKRGFHAVNDAQGNTTGYMNPATKEFVPLSDIQGAPTVMPPKPPSSVVGQAIAAGTMLQHIPEIRQEIGDLKSKLGPSAGRWNEFMTGKVGADDPDFTKLRTNIALLQTRLMQAHVGLRGSDQLMAHFKNLIDQGYQSPENMGAALDTIESYLQTYRGMAGGSQPDNSQSQGKVWTRDASGKLIQAP